MGRFKGDDRAALYSKRGEQVPALCSSARQVADEDKRISGKTRGHQRGYGSGGAGDRANPMIGLERSLNQFESRIGQTRRAGVADQGDITICEGLQYLVFSSVLIVFVVAEQGRADLIVGEQFPRVARVLSGDGADLAEHAQGA